MNKAVQIAGRANSLAPRRFRWGQVAAMPKLRCRMRRIAQRIRTNMSYPCCSSNDSGRTFLGFWNLTQSRCSKSSSTKPVFLSAGHSGHYSFLDHLRMRRAMRPKADPGGWRTCAFKGHPNTGFPVMSKSTRNGNLGIGVSPCHPPRSASL